jgi:hypothetical protein
MTQLISIWNRSVSLFWISPNASVRWQNGTKHRPRGICYEQESKENMKWIIHRYRAPVHSYKNDEDGLQTTNS